MTLNEVKKRLYKEKPIAHRTATQGTEGDIWYYQAHMENLSVAFSVPVIEMGENEFEKEIPAQLLIRWINKDKYDR